MIRSRSASNGVTLGLWLAERAALAMISEYHNRPGGGPRHPKNLRPSVGEKRIAKSLKKLRGMSARHPEAFHAELRALDQAIRAYVRQTEETAFVAAWSAALNLKGGAK